MKDPGRSRHWNHQTHPGASTRASYVMIFVFALLNVACEASPYPWLATYSCAEHQIGVIGPNDTDTDTDTDDTDGPPEAGEVTCVDTPAPCADVRIDGEFSSACLELLCEDPSRVGTWIREDGEVVVDCG